MTSVVVRNGNVESALRVFKRKVTDSGVLLDLKEGQFFEKKSTKKNRKKRAAAIREQRRQDGSDPAGR